MNFIQAIIIGIVQGLTEFIPVSSTAHMTICAQLMKLQNPEHPEQWTAFMAIVQLGTLAAVLLYFASDIKSIAMSWIKETVGERRSFSQQSDDAKMGWLVILGSVPIVVIGFALKKIIEGKLTKNLTLIATMLIVVSLVLIVAERAAKQKRMLADLSWKDAIVIGLAQCFALVPGTSRSGSTIAAGLFLGIEREAAARFSFLLSIPAVFASGIYECYKALPTISSADLTSLVVATLVAWIVGYLSIAFLLRYLRTHSLMVFIVYRVVLAIVVFALLSNGTLSAL